MYVGLRRDFFLFSFFNLTWKVIAIFKKGIWKSNSILLDKLAIYTDLVSQVPPPLAPSLPRTAATYIRLRYTLLSDNNFCRSYATAAVTCTTLLWDNLLLRPRHLQNKIRKEAVDRTTVRKKGWYKKTFFTEIAFRVCTRHSTACLLAATPAFLESRPLLFPSNYIAFILSIYFHNVILYSCYIPKY